MIIDLHYPVRRCHYCDQIMFYNRYESGENYAYCNNHAHTSCMGFTYSKIDGAVKIKEFTISDLEILYFRVHTNTVDGETTYNNSLMIHQIDGPHRRIENLLQTDINTILDKDNSLKLLRKIHKAILLLD